MAKKLGTESLPAPIALRVFRARHRLSQVAFGERVGLRGQAISDYEREVMRPDLVSAVKIELGTCGAVRAASWVDPAALGKLGEQFIQDNAEADEASAANTGRRRGKRAA